MGETVLSERDDITFFDRWWFPASIGSAAFILANVIGMSEPPGFPGPIDAALGLFGLSVGMLDGFGSLRIINSGTLRGPEERGAEAEARFYEWRRAKRRYMIAAILSSLSAVGVATLKGENSKLFVFLSGLALYLPVWAFDLYRSLREAKRLFPPPTASSE